MAIYSRFGCELEITGYCGKHPVERGRPGMVLVRATRKDDGTTRHYFAYGLKADDGLLEIDAAVDAVPEVTLDKAALKAAINEAS